MEGKEEGMMEEKWIGIHENSKQCFTFSVLRGGVSCFLGNAMDHYEKCVYSGPCQLRASQELLEIDSKN